MFAELNQYADTGFWILQAVVGLIFIMHGVMKLKTPAQVGVAIGGGAVVGMIFGAVEIAAGLSLITDIFAQVAGLVTAVIMVGAIYFKISKWKTGFMAQAATGWEFDLVLLAASIAFLTR